MDKNWRKNGLCWGLLVVFLAVLWITMPAASQDRLKTYPGYERYTEISKNVRGSVQSGALAVKWADDGNSFEYNHKGRRWRFDIKTKNAVDIGKAEGTDRPMRKRRAGGPARGRQYTEVLSPDEKTKALYKDRNLWLSDADGKNEFAVTTDGEEKDRTKYGSASWVYGEELGQNTAMWWSPDSKTQHE